MSLLTGGVFCLQCRRLALTFSVRRYRWKQPTFYDILGIHPEASQAEVKEAYVKLSKEYHPDMNQNVTKQDKELIHSQYVKINEAYSVLGKESQRRHYDAQIFVKIDPDQFQRGEKGKRPARSEAMTFEERARAYGFKPQVEHESFEFSLLTCQYFLQDPNFYENHGNYHKKVILVYYCSRAISHLTDRSGLRCLDPVWISHLQRLDILHVLETLLRVGSCQQQEQRGVDDLQEQRQDIRNSGGPERSLGQEVGGRAEKI